MAEITADKGLLVLVDKEKFLFGEQKEDAVVEYSFKFQGDSGQIEYIEKGCGCTSAYFNEEKGTIEGTLDLAKANGAQGYSNGETAVNKYLFVWLNDGQKRFIADKQKQKLQNPKKSWFRLQLVGTVVK